MLINCFYHNFYIYIVRDTHGDVLLVFIISAIIIDNSDWMVSHLQNSGAQLRIKFNQTQLVKPDSRMISVNLKTKHS